MKTHSNLTRAERINKLVANKRTDIVLVLENLEDEKNLSMILRSAEAFGLQKIIVVSDKKPKLPKGPTSGAFKWLEIEYSKTIGPILSSLKKQGFLLIGALVDPAAPSLWNSNLVGKIALVMGNESKGLSAKAQKKSDQNLYLPMYGLTESLNVSVATGIFLYEIIRQKENK